jgi:hypothetical protein
MRTGTVIGITFGSIGVVLVSLMVFGFSAYVSRPPTPGTALGVDDEAIVCNVGSDATMIDIPVSPDEDRAWVQQITASDGWNVTGFGVGPFASSEVRQGFAVHEPAVVHVWLTADAEAGDLTALYLEWSRGEPVLLQTVDVAEACG